MIYETVNEIYLFSYSFILDCLRWIRQINRRFYPALHIVIKVMAQHFHCCSSFDSHSRVFNYQQTLKWVCFIICMHCLFVYKYCYSDSRKLWAVMKGLYQVRVITVFTVFRLLTDFVCLYTYVFWLSLCKIARSSVILLLPLSLMTLLHIQHMLRFFFVVFYNMWR